MPEQSTRTPSAAKAGGAKAVGRCLNPMLCPPLAQRILVIRLGALGDVVRTLPAVAALRAGYPEARLAWLVESGAAAAVREYAHVDQVIEVPRPAIGSALRGARPRELGRLAGELARSLRGRFDLSIDFHSILRSGLLARFSGAPLRVSYDRPFAREGAERCANHWARLAPRRMSRFDRNTALVEFLGIPVKAEPPFRLRHSEEALDRARAWLSSRFAKGRRVVLLHPGTSPATPHKRYGALAYGRVARSLRARCGAHTVVAQGVAEPERALADRVVASADGAAVLAPLTREMADLGALIAASDVFVGSDSGPLHIASLTGVPVVQLLGPTHPLENQPYQGSPWRRVYRPQGCSPCRRGCLPASCMGAIAPEDVALAVADLLGQERGPSGESAALGQR